MTKEEEKYTTLDTDQCKWWVNTLFNIAKEKACNSHNFDDGEEMQAAQDKIINALEMVEEFEKAQIITGGRLNGRTYAYKCGLEDGKRKALEQQPSDDKVTITMDKGTLKYSGKGYVVYNKDWFREHFATEVKIMTGYDGYIEQHTSEDCVSRKRIKQIVSNITAEYDTETIHIDRLMDEIDDLPPVTPKIATSDDCVSRAEVLLQRL